MTTWESDGAGDARVQAYARRRRSVVWTVLVVCVAGVGVVFGGPIACFPVMFFSTEGEPLPTIDGPEEDSLQSKVECTLLLAESKTSARELTLVKLPEGESTTIELEHPSLSHSALARDGSVAYLYRQRKRLHLIVKDLATGRESTILERPGDFSDSSNVSLAPDGAHLALATCDDPGGFETTPGVLEILDRDGTVLAKFEGGRTWAGAQWFDDAVRFAFVMDDGVHVGNLADETILHIEGAREPTTGQSSVRMILPRSFAPSPSGNGRAYRWYDVDEGAVVEDLFLPGDLCGPIGFTADGLVLYEALPTTGTEQELLGWGMTYPSAKWTIKVCDPRTGRFATVVPYYGYGRIAFGPPARN